MKDDFLNNIDEYWNQLRWGDGIVATDNSILKLNLKSAEDSAYSNMQLDDYTMLSRRNYHWRAPLTMEVKARFIFSDNQENKSGEFQGTAGFGFWNNPFSPNTGIHALPESIWFFYASSKSQMVLSKNGFGNGWKAQVVHSIRWVNFLYFIPTSLAVLLAKFTDITGYSLDWIEKFSGVEEKIIDQDMSSWHTYKIEWRKKMSEFYIDDKKIMTSKNSPSQPLGFVAWVDNQYSVVTPKGMIKFGTTNTKGLSLEIDYVNIQSD